MRIMVAGFALGCALGHDYASALLWLYWLWVVTIIKHNRCVQHNRGNP